MQIRCAEYVDTDMQIRCAEYVDTDIQMMTFDTLFHLGDFSRTKDGLTRSHGYRVAVSSFYTFFLIASICDRVISQTSH